MKRRSTPSVTPFHAHNSPTLKWRAAKSTPRDPAGLLMAVTTCERCGANRFCEMGERMPYECVATPQWLRAHPGEARNG